MCAVALTLTQGYYGLQNVLVMVDASDKIRPPVMLKLEEMASRCQFGQPRFYQRNEASSGNQTHSSTSHFCMVIILLYVVMVSCANVNPI
jgi:hypothetical protein